MQIAHRKNGGYVLVPDYVSANQKHFDETRKPFRCQQCDSTGTPIEGPSKPYVLRGDLYGLHTTGTGTMVVSMIRQQKEKSDAEV